MPDENILYTAHTTNVVQNLRHKYTRISVCGAARRVIYARTRVKCGQVTIWKLESPFHGGRIYIYKSRHCCGERKRALKNKERKTNTYAAWAVIPGRDNRGSIEREIIPKTNERVRAKRVVGEWMNG